MASCNECLYQPICNTYASFGVTDLPASDISPCEMFKNKADYAEVVHSEWELCDDGSGVCKNCNTHQKAVWDMDGWQRFCGRCGAKMDGERKEG